MRGDLTVAENNAKFGFKAISTSKAKKIYSLNDWVLSLISALFIVILLLAFIFRIVMVDGDSMLPTLHDRERLIISSIFYEPEQGDIVVVETKGSNAHPIIKRVIATGGQKVVVDYENDTVSVYDAGSDTPVVLNEPYINNNDIMWTYGYLPTDGDLGSNYYTYDEYYTTVQTAVYEVPEGCYFVLGDNRNNSKDSRSYETGYIEKDQILGEVVLRFMPFNKF